jgi:hypothetical protein
MARRAGIGILEVNRLNLTYSLSERTGNIINNQRGSAN